MESEGEQLSVFPPPLALMGCLSDQATVISYTSRLVICLLMASGDHGERVS